MAYYKEIVTKAVIGKGKKTITEEREINLGQNIDNVLGCWVINHSFSGNVVNDSIVVSGNYDVNVWYSCNNNTKTNVIIKNFNYQVPMKVKLKENSKLNKNSEIIVRSLNQPSVSDVELENGVIKLIVDKQMGVEVIGDTIVRVSVEDEMDEYEEIIDDDIEVNEDYLT
ncbi:MAG: outer spore coat protein CotE [Erysipelotrichales bacterium]|nr:outer spore coat protein CotE [Erysipelotrichales bacterium]